MIQFVTVKSKAIKKVGYDASNKKMFIQFQNSPLYAYSSVPEKVFKALSESETPGAYFQQHVRDNYETQRVV